MAPPPLPRAARTPSLLPAGHVDAGAYEYRLQPADVAGARENWYLRLATTFPQPLTSPFRRRCPSCPGAAGLRRCTYPGCPLTASKCRFLQPCSISCAKATWPWSATCISASATTTCRRRRRKAPRWSAGERRAWGRADQHQHRTSSQSGTVSPHSDGRLSGLQAGTDLWADAHWRAGLYVGQLDGDIAGQAALRAACRPGRRQQRPAQPVPGRLRHLQQRQRASTPTPCCRPGATVTGQAAGQPAASRARAAA